MPRALIRFLLRDGSTPRMRAVRYQNASGEGEDMPPPAAGDVWSVELPALAMAADHGYWGVYLGDPADDVWGVRVRGSTPHAVRLPSIPQVGPRGWWHGLHGIGDDDLSRGAGITIGVVDDVLAEQGADSCIRHVRNLHPRPDIAPEDAEHAQAVCSLIGSRIDGASGFMGIAPGAELVFAAAGEHLPGALSPTRLANALVHLSQDHACDVISVSAGDDDDPTPEIEHALEIAKQAGSLCVFAAGNRGGPALYPARYDDCLAVAACGLTTWAPRGTLMERVAGQAPRFAASPELYLWSRSARGPGVDLLAAGAGPVWCSNGRAAHVAIGTSYAAPIAAGVVAVLLANSPRYSSLPRGAKRAAEALEIVRRSCNPIGVTDVVALGLPTLRRPGA